MEALVYKSTGSWYIIRDEAGTTHNARVKGVMKMEGISSTNPIAVGDVVEFELEDAAEQTATITGIRDRRNYIVRRSPHSKTQHHIIAANLDQCLLFATVKEPRTSQGFIDRFLITAEAYHIPALIVFNKTDVYRKKEQEKLAEYVDVFESVGYRVLAMSVHQNEGVDAVKEILRDKITLLSGHSGVGKSSFINVLFPELNLKIQDVSGWSGKGMHTTTFAEMHDLPFGGKVIDTPGIRELGLVHITKQELSHYYPEMRAVLQDCQFNNCLHTSEPGCAVKAAVAGGEIHAERYVSYCNILDTIEDVDY